MTVTTLAADQHLSHAIQPLSLKPVVTGRPKVAKQNSGPNVARRHPDAPGGTPSQLSAPVTRAIAAPSSRPTVESTIQLSDRGLAAIICAFIALMVVAGAVLVTQFIAITSSAPAVDAMAAEALVAAPLLPSGS